MATSLGKVGIVDRGNYLQEETYNAGDFVLYNGSTWLALKDGLLGAEPAEGTNWKYLARGFEAEVLSLITATDTSGLLGEAEQQVNAQSLLDVIADKVANRLLDKGMIANNLVTTNENMVLAAPMGKNLQEQISDVNNNIDNIVQGKSKGIFTRNSIVYIGEMANSAGSLLHFKIDRSAYYDGVGSMDVWVHGNHGMMCKYETGASLSSALLFVKNVSAYKKDGRVYVYVTAPEYNDSWRILDYGTRGDARFDCKVVNSLPTDAELIYDLSSGKGLVGDSFINGNKLMTNSDLTDYFKDTDINVATETDWNSLVNPGAYSVSNVLGAHAPSNIYQYGVLLVFKARSVILQVYLPHANETTETKSPVYRIRYNNVWINWRSI